MTIGVIVFSLLLGAISLSKGNKNGEAKKNVVESNEGMNKGKYANQRKQEKKEKKAKFLDYSEQL
jgi:uncharacterized protein YacL